MTQAGGARMRERRPVADPGDLVAVAVGLLAQIAEDPMMRPSYRAAGEFGKHLARLRAAPTRPLNADDFRDG